MGRQPFSRSVGGGGRERGGADVRGRVCPDPDCLLKDTEQGQPVLHCSGLKTREERFGSALLHLRKSKKTRKSIDPQPAMRLVTAQNC